MSIDLRVASENLATADDAELAWRVIEPAYDAVSIYDGPEALARQLRGLTVGQRALLAMHRCVTETLNGGFDQFFANSSGLFAAEARDAFERIGVPAAAMLLDEAKAIFHSRPAEPDADVIGVAETDLADQFDAYCARYEPLEEHFYALLDTTLYGRAAAYVRAHPTEFIR